MAKTIGNVQRTKAGFFYREKGELGGAVLNESSLGGVRIEQGDSSSLAELQRFPLAELVTGQEEILPSPSWGSKVVANFLSEMPGTAPPGQRPRMRGRAENSLSRPSQLQFYSRFPLLMFTRKTNLT